MKKSLCAFTLGLFAVAATAPVYAQNKVDQELDQATRIIHELSGASATAGIPDAVFRDAKCIAVIPKMLKAGFVVGGQHGDGVATCRTEDGHWSPPAPFSLTGASFGLQIGGEEMGYVMMIMNDQGLQALMSGHFKVGAGVDAAAGPVGRATSASGGWNAAILSYSRAKGAYAGATLNGAELNQDHGATKALFGHEVKFDSILNGGVPMPDQPAAHQFISTVHEAVEHARAGS